MSKFIDKNYAKETMEVHQVFTWIEQEALKVALEAFPIVTPKVKEGKWIYKDSLSSHWTDVYECSKCGATYRITTYNLESELPDHCPNCKAKMEV